MLNPFNFGTPVSSDKMVGRWHEVETIATDLINPNGLSHAVIGGRRFGKSSLLESLQHYLVRQVEQTKKENWYVLPFLINFKRLPQKSVEGVFGFILRTIYKYFTSSRIQKVFGLDFKFDLQKSLLFVFVQEKRDNCTQEEFSDIIDDILEIFTRSYGSLRLVLLIDEVEEILDEDWSEALFGQLRSLIYEWLLRDSMRYVIAGSSQVIDVREKGSPLFNMLNITFLKALEDKYVFEIINRALDVPLDVANAVLENAGGHPYIVQYIMYHLYTSGLKNATTDLVLKIVNQFIHERFSDLEQWKRDIEESGQLVYQILIEKNSWLTEGQVRRYINNPELSIERGLVRLCYHSLAVHKDWSEYRCTVSLFARWFESHRIPLQKDIEVLPKPPENIIKNKTKIDKDLKYQEIQPLQGSSIIVVLQLTSLNGHTFEVSISESPNGETPPIRSILPYEYAELIPILKALCLLKNKGQVFTSEQINTLQRLKLWTQDHFVPDFLDRIGISLYEALAVGDIRHQLTAAFQEGRKYNLPVTLQLRFYEKDVKLARYPWELIHDKRRHLLPAGAVELIRYISYPEPVTAFPISLPLRLLYIRSRPIKMDALPSRQEEGILRYSLHDLEEKGLLTVEVLEKPTFKGLVDFLENHTVHMIHFDSHGVFARQCPNCGEMNYPHFEYCQSSQQGKQCSTAISHIDPRGYLALESANRRVYWLSSEKLGALLYRRKIQLVVLSACRSSDVGGETLFSGNATALIQAGIPAVVSIQLPISVESAISFFKGFYSKLAALEPIPTAVNSGRLRIYDTEEWFLPTLYLRSKDNKGILFRKREEIL